MAIYFHGTCGDNLEAILENGFKPSETNWTPSEPNTTYFWSPDALEDAGEAETKADAQRVAFSRACDSAIPTLARAKDCRRVIFAVEFSQDDVSEDNSCQNMEGAVCHFGIVPPSKIVGVWVDNEDIAAIAKPYALHFMQEHELANKLELTRMETAILRAYNAGGLDSIFEILEELSYEMKKYLTRKKIILDKTI